MEFIRENILKILLFIVILVVGILIFSLIFNRNTSERQITYSKMEDNLLESAMKYASDNQKLIPNKENETNKINLDTLVSAKYIKDMNSIEDENIKCTGYVELLYRNKKNLYIPYLKCGKYYETKTMAGYVISNEPIVTSGSGLYKYGDTYVYRGENPNNYLGIGNRLYRIIDINENGEVRLISNKRINKSTVWDDRYNIERKRIEGINDYSKSRLKDFLNDIVENNSTDEENENYCFSSAELDKMIYHDICVGKRASNNGAINSQSECQVIEQNQKVSLITVSDYARASVDPNCNTIFDKSCMNYNYFSQISSSFRTITATSDNTYQVFFIDEGVAQLTRATTLINPNIVIYIDNISLYKSGNGTFEDPYTIR